MKEKNDDWFSNISIGSPVVPKGRGFAVGAAAGLVGLTLYYTYIKKYKSVEEQSKASSHVKSSASDAKDVSGAQNSNPKNEAKPKRVYKELDTLD